MSDGVGRALRVLLQVFVLGLAFVLGGVLLGGTDAPAPVTASTAAVWTCSMHPQIRQGEPGACPLCGMDLVEAGGADCAASGQVVLSERARLLARLQTTPVRRQGDATAEVRLLGRVEPDETTRKNVTTWVGGRIDRLHVNTTGESVRAGQVVASLYSPEVYLAHQDLLTAKGQVARLSGGSEAARSAAVAALGAARERLRLLGVPERELTRLEAAERPTQSIAIRSPFAGTVIERVATEGAYVQTGAQLYRVADLGRLWVQLDAYENDLPRLAVDQAVEIRVEGLAGEVYKGQVAFIDPTLDPVRRTAKVRVAVPNTEGRLRPGMFAEAVVSSGAAAESGTMLVVPATAPLFTGRRSLVYVELDGGESLAYVPRTVRLGPRLGDFYPVVAGLSEGERVVSRGAFAIDADLQIRGGPSMMNASEQESGAFDSAVSLRPGERKKLAPVLDHYLAVQRALAEDDLASARGAATQVEQAVIDISLSHEAWDATADAVRTHARHVASAPDIEGARLGFESLSAAVMSVLRRYGNPLDGSVHVAFCPMAQGDVGAVWVQQGTVLDNAYFGAAMRDCGEIRHAVAPGGYLQ